MYDIKLWKTSGHWQHYKDDMFAVVDPKNDKCCCATTPDADEGLSEVGTTQLLHVYLWIATR